MINRVTLVGNLGRDPEVRRLENGTPVARLAMATNESYKDNNGEWQTQTEWHDVVAWRSQAEQAERLLKKGSMVYVEGKLTHRKYTDKNGVDRYITEVVAQSIKLLDRREGGGREGAFPTQEPPMTSRQSSNGDAADFSVSAPVTAPPEPADDLPF